MAETAAMTMTQKIIAIAVTIIIISTVAIPVIENAQESQYTVGQNVGEKYTLKNTTSETTLSLIDGVPALNGVKLSELYPDLTSSTRFYVLTDSLMARAGFTYDNNTWGAWSLSSLNFTGITNYTIAMDSDISVLLKNGIMTVTNADPDDTWTEFTGSYSNLIIPDSNGNYGQFPRNNLPLYIDSGKTVYLADAVTGSFTLCSGTVDNLVTRMAYASGSDITDSSSLALTYTPTENDASNEVTAVSKVGNIAWTSGAMIIAPINYTIITDDAEGIASLIGIIPILLILVPVMLAVRMIALKRN